MIIKSSGMLILLGPLSHEYEDMFPCKCKVLLNQKCSITSHKI